MAVIELKNVDLAYPIYSVRAQSLRNAIANFAVGGKLLKSGKDVVHVKALDKVSFKLNEGDRMGIIGHNGAGKTTLLKVLAGVYEPDKGAIKISGRISSMIDISLGLDTELTGRENIINMGRMRGYTTKQILQKMDSIIEFSDLGQFIDIPIKTYSAGMTTRLVFAVATSLEPDILLMDEWIGAGDASFFDKALNRINNILENSRVMVLATHSFHLVKETCNKVLVLDRGSQVYFGDIAGWDFDKMCAIS
ncbi:ABC transporter ATP-binding protein [Pseudaquidulcibacter saccharophilus]|uniref:ABC transporter ATP-binding protein n=1 Tax=Pseudaquidulcibacter saccharophilus TaxID=2831900 RepID=UPI001EFF328F|nr:ABC transporter ATP-binding protein [Pseudaquidulcibacter saccharophilus]